MMRVTFNTVFTASATDLARASEELATRQREVSSGRRVHTPSDDPAAAAASVRERTELGTLDRYAGAADSANSRLSVVDTVLSDIIERLTAGQTAIMSALGSSATQAQRDAAANELEGIRDALASDFNTQFRGEYLFSGTAALVAPYQRQAGGAYSTYQGDAGTVQIDIDRDRAVDLSLNADTIARGTDTDDVFAQIERAIAAARSGTQADLATAGDALKRAFGRATGAQSRVGTSMNAIASQQTRIAELKQAGESRINGYEAVNMAEAIARMNQADTAYRAALGAIGTTGRASLMDYLK